MGRKKIWPPPMKVHKASGQVRVRINGRDHYLGAEGSPQVQKNYARVLAEHERLLESPTPPVVVPDVDTIIADWIEQASKSCNEKDRKNYFRALMVLSRTCGEIAAPDFTPARLRAVRDAMMTGSWRRPEERAQTNRSGIKRGQLDWCRSTCNAQVARIRNVWRWAEEMELVPRGSWAALGALRGLKKTDRAVRHGNKTRPATWDDLQLVLSQLRSEPIKAMLTLQYWTGARSGEIRRMKAGEIDRTQEVWLYRPEKHKTEHLGNVRVIGLGAHAREVLARWLSGKRPEQLVFRSKTGRPYTGEHYGRASTNAGRRAGLDWFRPYCLRHGAKQRFTREHGLDVARALLGQSSIDTTNTYGMQIDLSLVIKGAKQSG